MKLIEKERTHQTGSRSVRIAAICLVITAIAVLGVLAGAQQGPRVPREEFVLRTATNLVLVDVRVRDKSGRTVADLKGEDFRLFEEGERQTISLFSFKNIEALERTGPAEAPAVTVDVRVRRQAEQPQRRIEEITRNRRLLVLFFDLTSMPVEDLMRTLKATREFVERQMSPADLVSVVTYTSSLRVLANFTNQRERLLEALGQIRLGESGLPAEKMSRGGTGVAHDVSAAFIQDETELNIFNTDRKLAAIESLARMLREIPARKAVMHFSSGVTRTGNENQAQLRATIDAANQSNVSLYAVDARGLLALPPLGTASTSGPTGTAAYSGEAYAVQMEGLLDSRETLAALAGDTGGRDFYDLNDFGYIFQQVQEENSSYYLLGYYTSNKNADGKFRRIRVEVTRSTLDARGGRLRVKHRPGYFAPRDFGRMSRGDRERQLVHALNLENSFVELPVAIETLYFRLPEEDNRPSGRMKSTGTQAKKSRVGEQRSRKSDLKYFVVLSAKIPGPAVPFEKQSTILQTEFNFLWRVLDRHGHVAAMLHDTLPVKIDPGSYEQSVRSNLLYQGGITLRPGKYKLKVVVRENASGKIGTFEQMLNLPEPQGSDLALSSVVVSNQLVDLRKMPRVTGKKKGKIWNPLVIKDRQILPSVTRVFFDNQKLYVYLEAYGVRPGTDTLPQTGVIFFQSNRKVREMGPFEASTFGQLGEASFLIEVPLHELPPGRYQLQVNVLDLGGNRAAFARLPIAVLKSGRSHSQATGGK